MVVSAYEDKALPPRTPLRVSATGPVPEASRNTTIGNRREAGVNDLSAILVSEGPLSLSNGSIFRAAPRNQSLVSSPPCAIARNAHNGSPAPYGRAWHGVRADERLLPRGGSVHTLWSLSGVSLTRDEFQNTARHMFGRLGGDYHPTDYHPLFP